MPNKPNGSKRVKLYKTQIRNNNTCTNVIILYII